MPELRTAQFGIWFWFGGSGKWNKTAEADMQNFTFDIRVLADNEILLRRRVGRGDSL